MTKDTFYFSHDYGARNDPKLQKLQMKHGMEGIGIYWCLVEMMYEQGGQLLLSECESYTFVLRTHDDKILSIFNDFGLFKIEGDVVWSASIRNRLTKRNEKSVKAKESASSRWKNANAMRTHSEGNAIKERKVKDSIVNTNKDNKIIFKQPQLFELLESSPDATNQLAESFLDYYNSNGWMVGRNKMKDWKASFRNWIRNEKKFGKIEPKKERGWVA